MCGLNSFCRGEFQEKETMLLHVSVNDISFCFQCYNRKIVFENVLVFLLNDYKDMLLTVTFKYKYWWPLFRTIKQTNKHYGHVSTSNRIGCVERKHKLLGFTNHSHSNSILLLETILCNIESRIYVSFTKSHLQSLLLYMHNICICTTYYNYIIYIIDVKYFM